MIGWLRGLSCVCMLGEGGAEGVGAFGGPGCRDEEARRGPDTLV